MCVSPVKTNSGWNPKTQTEPHDVFLVTYACVWGRAVPALFHLKCLILSWTEELLLFTATGVSGEDELLLWVVASAQLVITTLQCCFGKSESKVVVYSEFITHTQKYVFYQWVNKRAVLSSQTPFTNHVILRFLREEKTVKQLRHIPNQWTLSCKFGVGYKTLWCFLSCKKCHPVCWSLKSFFSPSSCLTPCFN